MGSEVYRCILIELNQPYMFKARRKHKPRKQAFKIFTSITPKHHKLRLTSGKLWVGQSRMPFSMEALRLCKVTLVFRQIAEVESTVTYTKLALLCSCIF